MDARELCQTLGVDKKQIDQWLKVGLPSTGKGARRRFDAAAVERWLIDKGHLVPVGEPVAAPLPSAKIATTLADVAAHFGVNPRTVAGWRSVGMPGEPGNYPLDQIEVWRDSQNGRLNGHDHQRELMEIRAKRELLDYQREQGQLVEVAEPARIMLRAINVAAEKLSAAPDRVVSKLPAAIDVKTRERVRDAITEMINELREEVADALDQWRAELEGES